jgi:hypothetical protein
MAFTHFVVVELPPELKASTLYAARVFAASDTALRPNASIIGHLGAQAIDGLAVQPLSASVSGFVKQMPQDGDALRIGVDQAEDDETGLKYTQDQLPNV